MDALLRTKLEIQQGADVEIILPPSAYSSNGQNVDWSGFTGKLQIREDANNTGTPLLELTTANGGIVITGSQIKLVFTNLQTAAFNFGSDYAAQYDIELVQPGTNYVYKPYFGPVTMIPEITR